MLEINLLVSSKNNEQNIFLIGMGGVVVDE